MSAFCSSVRVFAIFPYSSYNYPNSERERERETRGDSKQPTLTYIRWIRAGLVSAHAQYKSRILTIFIDDVVGVVCGAARVFCLKIQSRQKLFAYSD